MNDAERPELPPMPPRRPWLDVSLVVLLVFFSFLLRQWHLGLPESRYFDELYYSKSGEELLAGKPDSNTVHPPLAKLIIAGCGWVYKAVGTPLQDAGWVGGVTDFTTWRAGSVLFGLLMVPLTYALGFRLFRSRFVALTGAFLLDIDFLHVVQSRITMLDMYLAFCVLLGAYGAWRFIESERKTMGWAVLSVLAFSVGFACKWSSLFAALGAFIAMLALKAYPSPRSVDEDAPGAGRAFRPTMIDRVLRFIGLIIVLTGGIWWAAVRAGAWMPESPRDGLWALVAAALVVIVLEAFRVTRWLPPLRGSGLWFTRLSFMYLFMVPLIYVVSFLPFMWQHGWDMNRSWNDARANHKQMFEFRYSSQFTHRYMSNFWAWPTMMRPVWYHYEEHARPEGSLIPKRTDRWLWRLAWKNGPPDTYVTGILAMGSPFVWWTFLIFLLLTVLQSLVVPMWTILMSALRPREEQVEMAADTEADEADRRGLQEQATAEPDVECAAVAVSEHAAEGLTPNLPHGPGGQATPDAFADTLPVCSSWGLGRVAPPRRISPWRRAVDAWRFGLERPWLFLLLLYVPQVVLWWVNRGFLFYMLPCVPLMCIFIAAVLREWLELPLGRLFASVYLGLASIIFVAYYPLLAGWSIPKPIYEVLIFTPKWI